MDFYFDNAGEEENKKITQDDLNKIIGEYKQSVGNKDARKPKSPSIFESFDETMGWDKVKQGRKNYKIREDIVHVERKVDELLKKTVITPQFEELHSIPQYEVAEKHRKILRRKEASKTKGSKWYGLPATEVTKEVKQNLQVLQMRSALNPKRFYKKNDLKVLPKYFQVGKVIDSPLDYYNGRLTKKERKKTLVDELLADVEFNKYNKRKYKEIIEDKQKTNYKAWKQAKKANRKSRFK